MGRLRQKILRRSYQLLATGIGLLMTTQALANSDRIFSIDSNGKLYGIPDEYGPIYVIVGKVDSANGKKSQRKVTLKFGNTKVHIPKCISVFFDLPKGQEMTVMGSWQHDISILPPYLAIGLPSKSYPAMQTYDKYLLLFNLKTGQLISLQKRIVNEVEKSVGSAPIEIEKICTLKERKQLEPSK
ncbi:MAG: hypothetical protein ACXVB8_08925 [Bdellovibrionota bacterium]